MEKFEHFGLTARPAERVNAPLIADCHANFECELADDALVQYNFFIFEVVKAHVVKSPKHPETLHYTGDGVFMFQARSSAAGRSSGRRCCRAPPWMRQLHELVKQPAECPP
jgi:flavin reductase (DIM6/NTAB) family NADH-FMN oxidoreductase RutF